MNQPIAVSILRKDRLPAMPRVVMKVLELCHDEEVNIHQVANAVESDPVLVARLLRLANSPLYAVGPVLSVEQAIRILGLRAVKVTVLGLALVDTVKGEWRAGLDYARYWRRSITMGVAARRLAQHIGRLRAEEAFLGGLLADIGLVAVQSHPSGVYAEVLNEVARTGTPLADVEKRILGATHAAISAEMLRLWRMPKILSDSVCAHHGQGIDRLEPRTKLLASVLWAAAETGDLFVDPCGPEKVEEVRQHASALTGIDGAEFDPLFEDLHIQVRELAETFNVDLSGEVSYRNLREQAVGELVSLTISAEKERATDATTGLLEPGAFEELATRILQDVAGRGDSFGLIRLTVDHLAELNARFGRQGEDAALRELGGCVRRVCAERVGCIGARYGGAEFAIAAPGISAGELEKLAETLSLEISRLRVELQGQRISFTPSIGLAHARPSGSSPSTLKEVMAVAGAALHES